MDFAQLPPEINSALMYSGAGSGPMLAAATAWEVLAGELQSTASSWLSVLNSLTDGPWQGPSSAAMAGAVSPQISWLSNAAAQAEQTAAQAASAAGAYEAAFAATVPPAEVAANRALLGALLATNFLGQNTAAIAATEALYGEMWAQDAGAMYSYSGASAAAAALPPFTPQTIASALGNLGTQVSALINAATATLNQPGGLNEIPKTLLRMAGLTNEWPAFANPQAALGLTGAAWNANGDGIVLNGVIGDVMEGLTGSQTIDGSTLFDTYIRMISPARLSTTATKDIDGLFHSAFPAFGKAAEGAAKAAEGAAAGAAAAAGNALGSGVSGLGGIVGGAAKVGAISVPASWVSTPAANPITVALNTVGGAAAAEPAASAFGGLPMMPAGAGRSVANFAAPRYGFKPTMVVQPPSGG